MHLLENVVDVILHGADLDAQSGGDLFVGESLVDQRQNAALASVSGESSVAGTPALRQRADALNQCRRLNRGEQ